MITENLKTPVPRSSIWGSQGGTSSTPTKPLKSEAADGGELEEHINAIGNGRRGGEVHDWGGRGL